MRHVNKIGIIGSGHISGQLLKALHRTALPDGCELIALNFEMPPDGSVPEWIELIPGGQIIGGRDGRTFINDMPDEVVDALLVDAKDIPLDWEHSTELCAPEGKPAPAAAWIKDLEVRDGGAIWGRVEWTEKGRASVAGKEYRYISPVFIYEKETLRIKRITSAGLTNQPNLRLQALNHQQHESNKENTMNWKQLLAKLGLAEDATVDQALNAIGSLQTDLATATNRAATPSLDKFVPRADYDATLTRAANAEQKLTDIETATLETSINSEVDEALKAGKIAPVSKDYYLGMCRQEGGLEQFQEFIKTAPVIAADTNLDGKRPAGDGKSLNAEEQQVAAMFGNSAEDIQKYCGEGSSS